MINKPSVLYLLKDRLQLFSSGLNQIVELRFPPDMVRDSDILKQDLLENLIKTFISNGKIPPSPLIVLFADNAYFMKDFTLPAQTAPASTTPQVSMETLHVMAMNFVEHVPYENVVSKTFPIKNGLKVCAVNKDYFDCIDGLFKQAGFTLVAVLPGIALGSNLTTKPVMDATIASTVIQKINSLKEFNLLEQDVYKPEIKDQKADSEKEDLEDFKDKDTNKKPSNKRLYIMLGVFLVLLIILGVVVYQNLIVPQPLPKSVSKTVSTSITPSVIPLISPTIQVSISPTVSSSSNISSQAATISVEVVSASAADTAGQSLHDALEKYPFKTVTLSTQSTLATSTTLVTFSPNVTTDVRNAVLEEVRKIKTNSNVQESQGGPFDVRIILAK